MKCTTAWASSSTPEAQLRVKEMLGSYLSLSNECATRCPLGVLWQAIYKYIFIDG